ncbi:MAG: hypothetical protein IJM18_06820, partial [Clostridia bacterium]|nr:hypothetical protein [Clostridia bacterium]
AENRFALMDDALYQQTLNAMPEDEPHREEKAHYLYKRGVQDAGTAEFLQDLKGTLTDRLMGAVDDIVFGDDYKQATVGQILDRFGFDEAGKRKFLMANGYDSEDQTLYDRQVKNNPGIGELPDRKIKDNINTALRSCIESTIADELRAQLSDELTEDERKRIADREEMLEKFESDGRELSKNIAAWVEEKGAHLGDELDRIHHAVAAQKYRMLTESNRSMKAVSTNASAQSAIDRQTVENAYISQIIKGERTADDLIRGVIEDGRKKLPSLERKTAEEFINDIRRGFQNDSFEKEARDYPAKQFADIFAARILADSVRNKRDSLRVELRRGDIDELSEMLTKNEQFNSFIVDTYWGEEDENEARLRSTERKLYASRTHGGFIEDEFKKYLLKRPAGELENSPELARFMPTAKEMIEELKRQVKNDPEDRVLQEKAAAEIIAIRNACRVERGTGYGLENRIPTAPAGKTLKDEVRALSRDDQLGHILRGDDTRKDLLAHGHGGQMTVNVRKRYEAEDMQDLREPATEAVLKKNTIGERIKELRAEARQISSKLAGNNAMLRSAAMERSKEVLGEFMALIDKGRNGVGADVPWSNVDALKKSTVNDATAQKMMNTEEKASVMMEAIASGNVGEFQRQLKSGIDAVHAEAGPKVEVSVQPGRITNGPQGPHGPGL